MKKLSPIICLFVLLLVSRYAYSDILLKTTRYGFLRPGDNGSRGLLVYELRDEQSDECSGEWFLVDVGSHCWRNKGETIEIKQPGFFKTSFFVKKPPEIGDENLDRETAARFTQAKQNETERYEKESLIQEKQFYDSRPSTEYPYQAVMSCTRGETPWKLEACMVSNSLPTNIEVRNGQQYSMADPFKLNIANSIEKDKGRIVLLRPEFQIRMQNTSNVLTMNLVITDRRSGKAVFQKSAGQYDFITASNRSLTAYEPIQAVDQAPYLAEITCGGVPISICFQSSRSSNYTSSLEVRSGATYKLYQYVDLLDQGTVFSIPLTKQFLIKAQNTNTSALLNIKIMQKNSGKILYQKSAGTYEYISIRSD
jgi:hypothetical protein